MLKAEVTELAKTAAPNSDPRELLAKLPATTGLGDIVLRDPKPGEETVAFEIHITGRSDWFAAALGNNTSPFLREGDLLVRRCNNRPSEINMVLTQAKSELTDATNNFNNQMQRQVLGMEDYLSSLLRERMRAEKKLESLDEVLARHGVKKKGSS